MNNLPEREMPRYKCHKRVWALKIAGIENFENGSARLHFAEPGYAAKDVDADF